LRDAQLASFLVTSVDNNIFFGAAASSVTKKKEETTTRQLYQSSVFSRSLSLKSATTTTKCQITNSQNTIIIMSLSRLRKAPGRWLESLSKWRRRGRDENHGASDTDVGGRCCEVSGNDLDRVGRTTSGVEGGPEVGVRHHHNRRDHLYNFNDDGSSLSGGSSGGGYGHDPGRPSDDMPVLSERDRKELMNLANENISMDFILEMKEAFQLFDKNGDGFISAKELGVLMRTLGRNPTEDEIMNIMNEIDVDHNGKLDFSEFTIMMRDKLSGEDMEQEIKQAFRVFDRNGDGFISKNEFKHCMMHFGEKFTDDEVEEMIAEADANNDGQIDYLEFSQMILKEIDTAENNGTSGGTGNNCQTTDSNNLRNSTSATPQKKLIS